MKARLARFAVLAAGLIGLFTAGMPAAEADTVGTLAFTGNATVTGDDPNQTIAYPCVHQTLPGTVTVDLNLCLLELLGTTTKPKMLPKPGDVNPTVNFTTRHNPSNVVFGHKTCFGVVVNDNKLDKDPVDVGACVIFATGKVWGHCGLSTGMVTGGLITPTNTFTFTVKFTGIAGELFITGHVTLSNPPQNGWIRGIVTAAPNSTSGSSCFDKHRLDFIIEGLVMILLT